MDSSNSGGRARIPRPCAGASCARRPKPPRAARDRGSTPSSDRPADRLVEPFSGPFSASGSRRRGTAPTVKRSRRRRHDADGLEPALQIAREVRELGGPDGAARVHHQLAVRRQPRGPRLARDRLADGLGPAPRDRRDVGRRDRPTRAARRRSRRSGPRGRPLMPPRPAGPARTPIVRETEAASSSPWVVVRIVCPGARRASSSRARRSRSSSDATSSSSSSGRSPRASASVSASASTSASRALRCSPCEPNDAHVARLGERDVVELRARRR